MLSYQVPLRDVRFLREEVFDFPSLFAACPSCEEFTPDLINSILAEAAKFAENVVAPLYQTGDAEGCTLTDEGVKTPAGFKEAYQQYIAAGWCGLSSPVAFGGQGLPPSMNLLMEEMLGTANWAWSMYPGLSHGAQRTMKVHGTPEQQQTYLGKLVSGEWTGTMCLTESHCGSDLGMLRTRAEPAADGSYRITGTKIFISSGDHDMADNIVHIVLARLPDSPPGTKGISLFIVPKMLPQQDGTLVANTLSCGSIEHKMGINGSATCVMNFDGATGFLVGEPNRGLNHMFTFMNAARIGTAMQGLAACERSYQGALAYAKERLQGRSLAGAKNPDGPADPLLVHPNIRHQLMTQKAFAEGSRALLYWLAYMLDQLDLGVDDEARQRADNMMALLTPIAKAFITEVGYECANHGVQIFGGHGFVREHGMEQIVRDTRIAMLYEGTTAIQALDLLGRKVLGTGGTLLLDYVTEVTAFCEQQESTPEMHEYVSSLRAAGKRLESLTMTIMGKAMENPEEVDAAATEYLMFVGYFVLAHMWARMAAVALDKLAAGAPEQDFYTAKIHTATFYFRRIFPRIESLALCIEAGGDSLMTMSEAQFAVA